MTEECKQITPRMYGHSIAFYLDGVSFVYKTMDQARALKGRVWRKKSEGLTQGCLAKGRKVGTGGKVARSTVAISHGKGVLVCDRCVKMDANYLSSFIDQNFNTMFKQSGKGSRTVIPLRTARNATGLCHLELLKIPPQSPIENIFNLASRKLEKDALQ